MPLILAIHLSSEKILTELDMTNQVMSEFVSKIEVLRYLFQDGTDFLAGTHHVEHSQARHHHVPQELGRDGH